MHGRVLLVLCAVVSAVLFCGCQFNVPEGMVGGVEREYYNSGLEDPMTHWAVFTAGSYPRESFFENPELIPEEVSSTTESSYPVVYDGECEVDINFDCVTFRITEEASSVFWEMNEAETLAAGERVLNLVLQDLVEDGTIISFNSLRLYRTMEAIRSAFNQHEEAAGLILVLNTARTVKTEECNGLRFNGVASLSGCFPAGDSVYHWPCAICF